MLRVKDIGRPPLMWHIGEDLPEMGQGVELIASFDELNLITAAMQASNGSHPLVDYTKRFGFQPKRRKRSGLHEGD